MTVRQEQCVHDANAFAHMIDKAKIIHVVADGGAKPNPSAAGWGILIRQNLAFTIMWKHCQHATNNIMKWRAVVEALSCPPSGMNFGVDSQVEAQWMEEFEETKGSRRSIVEGVGCSDRSTHSG
jgi:ribonuclease HI